MGFVEDELHIAFDCTFFADQRRRRMKRFEKYVSCIAIFGHLEKMKIIMADTETMMIFADFIQKVFHGISKIVKKHDLLQKFLYIIFFTQN